MDHTKRLTPFTKSGLADRTMTDNEQKTKGKAEQRLYGK
jgi:hypothetical protein